MLRSLVLMGLRGSGKSTVGWHIAEWSGRPLIDIDSETARVLGVQSVRQAWDQYGEVVFRLAESRALAEALEVTGAVIALGGGTPTAPGAAEMLQRECKAGRCELIYLAATAETLRERLRHANNSDRPSLTGADPLEEIEAVLALRDGQFRALASWVIQTDGRDPANIAAEIE